ncbi:hypothetical protein CISIN_1g0274012mg, partial [Citrus sinensis]
RQQLAHLCVIHLITTADDDPCHAPCEVKDLYKLLLNVGAAPETHIIPPYGLLVFWLEGLFFTIALARRNQNGVGGGNERETTTAIGFCLVSLMIYSNSEFKTAGSSVASISVSGVINCQRSSRLSLTSRSIDAYDAFNIEKPHSLLQVPTHQIGGTVPPFDSILIL